MRRAEGAGPAAVGEHQGGVGRRGRSGVAAPSGDPAQERGQALSRSLADRRRTGAPVAPAAELVAELRAPDGRVLIPGFMDDVRPQTSAEHEAIAALPPIEAELK